jgi:hypothetical protein
VISIVDPIDGIEYNLEEFNLVDVPNPALTPHGIGM